MYATGKLEGIAPGFEGTLKQWKEGGLWSGKIQFLETPEKLLDIMKQRSSSTGLLRGGIGILEQLLMHKKRKNYVEKSILDNYRDEIEKYGHTTSFLQKSTEKASTRARNKLWSENILKYLVANPKATSPILIVCGDFHLIGGISKGSNSFLEYLWGSKKFKLIQRIDKAGKVQNIDSLGKK